MLKVTWLVHGRAGAKIYDSGLLNIAPFTRMKAPINQHKISPNINSNKTFGPRNNMKMLVCQVYRFKATFHVGKAAYKLLSVSGTFLGPKATRNPRKFLPEGIR